MAEIKLRFINKSTDKSNSNVVIFQKNQSIQSDDEIVAWKVIENCSTNEHHDFRLPMNIQVAASDSWGNFTPKLDAYNGHAFDMIPDRDGDTLKLSSTPSKSSKEVEVRNNLYKGSINANIYKDGKLLAVKSAIVPGQIASFQMPKKIWIGVISNVREGEIINPADVNQVNTELDLLGVASADIVMTGGDPGKPATEYTFKLENKVYV